MSKRIIIYKGFDKEFLSKLQTPPLISNDISDKFDFRKLDDAYKNSIGAQIFDPRTECWVTYEEYEIAHEIFDMFYKSKQIEEAIVIDNNIFPGLYPLNTELEDDAYNDYRRTKEESFKSVNFGDTIKLLDGLYSEIIEIDGRYYCSYQNYEQQNPCISEIKDYYTDRQKISEEKKKTPYVVDLGNDLTRYIVHKNAIESKCPSEISVRTVCDTSISKKIEDTIRVFCAKNNIEIYREPQDDIVESSEIQSKLIDVAKDILKKENFAFRPLKFYKNPDLSNDLEEISQGEIMEYIVGEAIKAYEGQTYRDIFITAPTGAGKSLIFQLPSIYLSQNYNKLIIIIEPLKTLMNDQRSNLEKAGYRKSAYLNSDIASVTEREKIINDIKNGEIDLLYLSPETLLSHSIDSLIGDREIGLVIIDEAHIVTTWGVGFRPDYWYLGAYINKLRTKRDKVGKSKKFYDFPIFACTATAVNGGRDDTISDTFISLYMRDPITKIGYAKRDADIKFDIHTYLDTRTYDKYKREKVETLSKRIESWIKNKEKTIVYCPYSSIAHAMKNGEQDFHELGKFRDDTCVYTGGNYDKFEKNEAMEKFRNGDINVIYATKAFGMGVDISDIHNVYHYAVNGNLSDYIQEIGRAARKEDMVGTAMIDYFKGDMKFTKTLFGMSQIKQYHVKKCLSIIYDVYTKKRNSGLKNPNNFMINPKIFSGVFGKNKTEQLANDDTVNKLKIVLLMLEKDFYDKYGVLSLISRPGTMFTETYVSIDRSHADEVLNGKYGKYFKYESDGRDKAPTPNPVATVKTTDPGNIYKLNLKELWEDKYSNLSFAAFKYFYYRKNKEEDETKIIPEIREYLYGRELLSISGKNLKLTELYNRANEEIDFITSKLNEFGREFFTKDEFKKKLMERYKKSSLAEVIANTYLEVVDPKNNCVKTRRHDNKDELYQISNGNIRLLATSVLNKSSIIKNSQNATSETITQFLPENDTANMGALKLLSLLDLIIYELKGGDVPEIFIRLNTPDKIKNIVEEKTIYRNTYVDTAKEKHYRSVKVLDFFFTELHTNEERWDFIEKYFLGEDIESYIDSIKPPVNPGSSKNIIDFIDEANAYPLDDYDNWDEIIETLIRDDKYQYLCSVLKKHNVPLPSHANTPIKLKDKSHDTLFIFASKQTIIAPETVSFELEQAGYDNGWTIIRADKVEDNINKLI